MRILLFALAAFFFCGYQSKAQISRSSLAVAKGVSTIKGDYYFNHKNYVIAVNHYSKSVKQNPKDTYAMLRMAEAYHKLQKDDLASQWYSKAFALNPDVENDEILKYISFLNTLDKHDELKRWITTYRDRISKNYLNGALHNDSVVFILYHPVSVNSDQSDSGPFLYNDKLIFSSARAAAGNGWHKLYRLDLDPRLEFGEVMPFHENISSGLSQGAISITTEPSRLFFTEISQPSADGAALMNISYCDVPANPSDVLKINELAFKNFDHSMGHPAVNSNGTVMFFAASSPRHTRGFDLYKSEYNGKKWSAPVALGAAVNTHGDEMYPTLHNDSILYFASNVHGGLGGFDIYKVNIRHKNPHVEHLKAPVNSPFNDVGLVINNAGTEGYLSSNRPGGLGSDDLYKVYILPVEATSHTADKNASHHEALFIYTSKGEEIKLVENNKGNLKFDFTPGRMYNLTVEYDNFKTGAVNTANSATPLPKFNIYTFDIQKSAETHAKKNKVAPIQNIHINPGDLVTFQLTPNLKTDSWTDNGKIQFHNSETIVGDRESIVFSYVAAGGPDIAEIEDTAPIANLSALDTVSSTQPVAAKEIWNKPGEVSTTEASKTVDTTTKEKQLNTTTTTDAVKAINEANNSDAFATADTVINKEAITEDSRIADNQTEHSVSPAQPIQITPTSTIKTLSDSLNGRRVASKKDETKNPLHLPTASVTALQDQIVSTKDKNVDPNAGNENAVKADMQNTPLVKMGNDMSKSDGLATSDSVINASAITKESHIVHIQTENLVSPTQTTEITPQPTINTLSDSLNGKNVVSKANDPKDPTKMSAANATTLHDQIVTAIDKNIDSNATNENAVKTDQQNTLAVKTPNVLDDNMSSDSLSSENYVSKSDAKDPAINDDQVVLKNSQAEDEVHLSPAYVTTEASQAGSGDKSMHQNAKATHSDETVQDEPTGVKQTTDRLIPPDSSNRAVVKQDGISNLSASTSLNDENPLRTVPGNIDFEYRVQIAASQSELSDARLKKIYRGTREIRVFKEDGYFKYYIGQTPDYPAARNALQESGVDQAFITVYKGNIKWKLNQAIAFQKNQQNATALSSGESESIDPIASKLTVDGNMRPDETISMTTNDDRATPGFLASDVSIHSKDIVEHKENTPVGMQEESRIMDRSDDAVTEKAAPLDAVNETAAVAKKTPAIDSSLSPSTAHESGENGADFQYRLQIAASKFRLSDARLKKIYSGEKEIRSFKEDGLYKYYIQETPNYFVVRQTLKECNVEQAFISAYQGDAKWSLQDAITLQYKVPQIESELAKTDSIVKIVTVNFDLDEFMLLPDQVLHLRASVIDELKAHDTYHAIVNGYTDIQGSEEYNFGLSQERAFFVEQLIVKEGINSEKVTMQYFGESQVIKYCPEHGHCDESVHQVNRRVEILLLTNKK